MAELWDRDGASVSLLGGGEADSDAEDVSAVSAVTRGVSVARTEAAARRTGGCLDSS